MMLKTPDSLATLLMTVLLAFALGGCGSGSSPTATSTATTLGGTAATGAPIAGGSVNVVCAAGSNLTTTTAADGAWLVTLSGQTLPCAVQVSGGSLPAGQTYHSIAVTLGTVNITPITDLVVANLSGQSPGTWFGGLNANTLRQIGAANVQTALTSVQTALGLSGALAGSNPLTTAFSASAGDRIDDVLESLTSAMTTSATSYSSLLSAASTASFSPPSALATALSTRLALVGGGSSSGGSTGGAVTCVAPETALTFVIGAAGSPYTNGQQVCFSSSTTALTIAGATLSNPTVNTVVQAPFSAYVFSGASGIKYEVVFNSGALHEINVTDATGATFYGQFAAAAANSGSGAAATFPIQASGSGYNIAYTAPDLGLDVRSNVTATFNATTGALEGYTFSANEAPTLGSLTNTNLDGDDLISIGRWANGTSAGIFYSLPTFTLGQNSGFHYAVGKPTVAMPTSGVASYTLSKQTTMTFGSFNIPISQITGSVKVDLATQKLAAELAVTINGDVYTMRTSGGLTTPASSEISINGSSFGGFGRMATSAGCPATGCGVYLQGFFAGSTAQELALVVRLDNNTGSSWGSSALILVKQ